MNSWCERGCFHNLLSVQEKQESVHHRSSAVRQSARHLARIRFGSGTRRPGEKSTEYKPYKPFIIYGIV